MIEDFTVGESVGFLDGEAEEALDGLKEGESVGFFVGDIDSTGHKKRNRKMPLNKSDVNAVMFL